MLFIKVRKVGGIVLSRISCFLFQGHREFIRSAVVCDGSPAPTAAISAVSNFK
jgi:hypothetical protein